MIYIAHVQFRVDKPSTDSRHYQASVGPEPELEASTRRLVKYGPTDNNVARYAGSFPTEADARDAVSDFLAQYGMAVVDGDVRAVAYLRKNRRLARRAWPSERLLVSL